MPIAVRPPAVVAPAPTAGAHRRPGAAPIRIAAAQAAAPIAAAGAGMPLIAAVLAPHERAPVESAVRGYASLVHRDSIGEAWQVVRERPVAAVLVSVQRCRAEQLGALDASLRDFPAVPAVAFVSQRDPAATALLLQLGATGVQRVVDVTTPVGWRHLRDLLGEPPSAAVARVQGPLLEALADAPPDAQLFLQALLRLAPRSPSVRDLARQLGVPTGTLLSRFQRAGLPSPKNYLAGVRLLYAAELLEAPGRSVSEVTLRLDYSSPQSFGRHVRALLGITPTEFRRRLPFPTALERFLHQMVHPYRAQWARFHPLQAAPRRGTPRPASASARRSTPRRR